MHNCDGTRGGEPFKFCEPHFHGKESLCDCINPKVWKGEKEVETKKMTKVYNPRTPIVGAHRLAECPLVASIK